MNLPRTGYRELLLLLLRRRKRLKVVGRSMYPTLKPGDEILLDPYAYRQNLPQADDLIVTMHPCQNNLAIVKRIDFIDVKGNYFLIGDNPLASTDSREWGAIALEDIRGKVTSLFC